MYILIEHSGSQYALEYATKVQECLEDDFGATVEQIIGYDESKITLYSEDLKKIVELSINDPLDVLQYYMTNYYEDEL